MNEVIGCGLARDENPMPDAVLIENLCDHWISGGELGVNNPVRGSVVKVSPRAAVSDCAHTRPDQKAAGSERLMCSQLPVQTWRVELESSG